MWKITKNIEIIILLFHSYSRQETNMLSAAKNANNAKNYLINMQTFSDLIYCNQEAQITWVLAVFTKSPSFGIKHKNI